MPNPPRFSSYWKTPQVVGPCPPVLRLTRRTRARRTVEDVLAVGELDRDPVGLGRAVLRPVALDDDLAADREVGLPETAADEGVRRAGFHRPGRRLAVGALDVHVNPPVRVDPFHLRQRALQRHRL